MSSNNPLNIFFYKQNKNIFFLTNSAQFILMVIMTEIFVIRKIPSSLLPDIDLRLTVDQAGAYTTGLQGAFNYITVYVC